MTGKIVLASASQSRAAVLRNAGIDVVRDAADIDENVVKESFRKRNGSAADVARSLAEQKAMSVSPRHNNAFVIGADQMLQCEGIWFDKPVDLDQARSHLTALRGKTHELLAAVCVVRDGKTLWTHLESAQLTMRPFSDVFLEDYLASVGDLVCQSVGAYQLEGRGAQLFSRIKGDYFTILGLPLLPLLAFLGEQKAIPT